MNSSRRTRRPLLLLGFSLLATSTAFAAEVYVRALNSIDITSFEACSWGEGRPAPDHQVETEIRRTVEERLGGTGYAVVSEGGDCRITSHAVGDANFPVGVLMIEIHEVSTGRIAWRGEASGLVEGTTKQRMKRVRKVVQQMFKHFPKSASQA